VPITSPAVFHIERINVLASSSGGGGGAAVFVVIIVIGAYFLPTIVAVARKVTNQGSVAVINFFLGWTLVGWVVALAMACRTSRLVRDGVGSEIDGRRQDT
jgi:Superinfection immunity protein